MRESTKKKSGGSKLPPARKSSRTGAPALNREPRATANRSMARSGEKGTSGISPARGKRRLASPPPPMKRQRPDSLARRNADVEMPPGEDIS
ncbi:MAG TPA: hypothetical protein VFP36_04900 [Usitatibacter sp.]|nr:hypothetical protein [Usitatibacter sp.]